MVGRPGFQSAFQVDDAIGLSVSAAASAVSAFGVSRGRPTEDVVVDATRAAAAFTAHLKIDGVAPPKWADLSGYYLTRDGRQVQLHANFPHHAAGITRLLGSGPQRAAVEAAVATWDADALERALVADGMIAAKLRTLAEWDAHPHARATRDLPLLSFEQIGDAPPRTLPRLRRDQGAFTGVRVLDCARVLAGPVAGHTLAAHGADVLRVGAAQLPSVPVCVLTTGAGKRNAFVDLDTPAGATTLAALLRDTHVWIDAYRPGALAARGFSAARAAALNPGVVVVELSAFDWVGPWAGRRGFDSIVQSTTGIVDAGQRAAGASQPTPLPVQVLDFATGYLAAFAAARAIAHQARVGGSWRVRVSLLRTRNWLVGLGGPRPFTPQVAQPAPGSLYETDAAWGRLTLSLPPTGQPMHAPQPLGSSEPVWLP